MNPPLFVDVFPIRWGDMDALGHLNNTVYFRLCEEARVRWLEGRGYAVRPDSAHGALLASISCQFRAPVVYPCDVLLETRAGRIGRSSFVLTHRLARADQPDSTVAEVESVNVWCDYAAGRSLPLPDTLRQELAGGMA